MGNSAMSAPAYNGAALWTLFTEVPMLRDGEQREIAREAHQAAAKQFRIAADSVQRLRDRCDCFRSYHSQATPQQLHIAERQHMEALDQLVALPAVTKSQAAKKRRLIGRMWMRAEGPRFDRYRQSVATDEARLANGAAYADGRMSGMGR